jgi:hypothetical protein
MQCNAGTWTEPTHLPLIQGGPLMRRFSLGLAVAITGFMAASSATAEDNVFQRGGRYCCRDWARCNHWPEPFIYQDRDATVSPFAVMIAKGCQVQGTLTDHHFHPGSAQLTDAGVLKVQQILMDQAAHRRTIYVQLGMSPEQTQARMAAARTAGLHMLPPGAEPVVLPTSIQAYKWPADNTVRVMNSLRESAPKVQLPAPRKDGGGQ